MQQSLSFSQAIQATQSLIKKIDSQQLDEAGIEQEVLNIVNTKNGARGFFVAYLTSEVPLVDSPSTGIINGLKSHINIVSELLIKNLAMSSAMIVTHKRNEDLDNVRGSHQVCKRTKNLIQIIEQNSIKQELEKLKTTIVNEEGEYDCFLKRWGYDAEQKRGIKKAIIDTLTQ